MHNRGNHHVRQRLKVIWFGIRFIFEIGEEGISEKQRRYLKKTVTGSKGKKILKGEKDLQKERKRSLEGGSESPERG